MSDDKVIYLKDRKPNEFALPDIWEMDVRVFCGVKGWSGTILGFNPNANFDEEMTPGQRMVRHAEALESLSWMLRQQAENLNPTEQGMPLATALVFENSAVRVRINDDKVVTAEQFEWLDRRFDDAKEAARPRQPS